jgi:pimeloyl-ACP methyl ester carboxylesterase
MSDQYVPLADAPAWFVKALAQPYQDATVEVDGASIHYLCWGEPGRNGLVFVHGGGAHAYWWAPLAATFASEYRVVAVDLSGHGESDHRSEYEIEQWAAEVVTVARDEGIAGKPVVVGHSMGGFVTIATAALFGDELAGAIICDSPVDAPDPEVESFRLKQAFGSPRIYATTDEALSRFRTVPPQDRYLDYVMDFVARKSLRPTPGGFRWKFDHHIFEQFAGGLRSTALPYLNQVRCRLALLRSEHGLVTEDIGRSMFNAMGRVTPVIELPEAGHHAMLDQPLTLLTALRTLLGDWEHSEPHRVARRNNR